MPLDDSSKGMFLFKDGSSYDTISFSVLKDIKLKSFCILSSPEKCIVEVEYRIFVNSSLECFKNKRFFSLGARSKPLEIPLPKDLNISKNSNVNIKLWIARELDTKSEIEMFIQSFDDVMTNMEQDGVFKIKPLRYSNSTNYINLTKIDYELL